MKVHTTMKKRFFTKKIQLWMQWENGRYIVFLWFVFMFFIGFFFASFLLKIIFFLSIVITLLFLIYFAWDILCSLILLIFLMCGSCNSEKGTFVQYKRSVSNFLEDLAMSLFSLKVYLFILQPGNAGEVCKMTRIVWCWAG